MEIFKNFALFFLAPFLFLGFLTVPVNAQETSFIVTTVSDFNNGVSTNTTVSDIGGGDGSITNTLGAEIIDQSQTTGNTGEVFDNTQWLAQTFTAGISGLLSKITLSLDRNDSVNTNGTVVLELRATTSGAPSSTVISSRSVAASTLNRDGKQNVDFLFSSLPVIKSGTVYALVIYRSGSGTIADYNWYRGPAGSGNDQYSSGSRFHSGDSGMTWVRQTLANPGTGDLLFTTFIRSYATTGSHASDVLNTGFIGSEFTQISWNETLPPGTDITFEVRTSRSVLSKTDSTPSWISLGAVNSPTSLTQALPETFQYFQWRATLTGSTTATPTLENVTITYKLPATVSGESSTTPSPTTAEVTWTTDRLTSSRVVWDTISHSVLGDPPNYGYAHSTDTFDRDSKVTTHRVTIPGLSDGTVYYFRTISEGSPVAIGEEQNFKTLTYAGPPTGVTASPASGVLGIATTPGAAPKPKAPPKKVRATPSPIPFPKTSEVRGEEAVESQQPTPELTPITPSYLTLLFETIRGLFAVALDFFTRLFGK